MAQCGAKDRGEANQEAAKILQRRVKRRRNVDKMGKHRLTAKDNPKPFTSENQPPNRGRKPRVFSELAKDFKQRGIERATPEAVKEAYEFLLALTLQEIKDIAGTDKDKENDYPAILRVCAGELIGKRRASILSDILDRAHGRPKQAIDHTSGGEPIESGGVLSEETEKELLKLLRGEK